MTITLNAHGAPRGCRTKQPHEAGHGAEMFEILLVEDNPADAELTREALQESVLASQLHVVSDGLEALAFLHRTGRYADAPTPDLILLDLNLPRVDGRGVLTDIKQDVGLRDIPVVVLSSSAAPRDVSGAYALGANCYVTKPVSLDAFLAAIRAVEQFWIGVATLPTRGP
jgi:CheY-like chemotaxis protein